MFTRQVVDDFKSVSTSKAAKFDKAIFFVFSISLKIGNVIIAPTMVLGDVDLKSSFLPEKQGADVTFSIRQALVQIRQMLLKWFT